MKNNIRDVLLKTTGAEVAEPLEVIQRLWSGYGNIVRYRLNGGEQGSVIVKHVQLPKRQRSANNDLSHCRKLRSYQVETAWYGNWSKRCDAACRVPACLASATFGDEIVIVLEDLDAAGYPQRRTAVGDDEIDACQ